MLDVVDLLEQIGGIGKDRTGGYRRFALTDTERELAEWFDATAGSLGLSVECDRNGNRWAWWGNPADGDAIVTGSHLDSVPRGGAFDGPLGVASGFAAVASMKDRGVQPVRPIALACFTDEEGGRFGLACLGSRLMTGVVDPTRVLGLRDDDGITVAEAMQAQGRDIHVIGPDLDRLAAIDTFVELHVEQGRALIDTEHAVGVGTRIWPHGRWRCDITGRADHAGTARMMDRDDPMLTLAALIDAAHVQAGRIDSPDRVARATIGRVQITPNAINAIPAVVTAWLDARAGDEQTLTALVDDIARSCGVSLLAESGTPEQTFDRSLAKHLSTLLAAAPLLDTGAGHDAGVLSDAGVRSAMLFVRNPTGVSHAPEETAEESDCRAGVEALERVLVDLSLTRT